MGPLPIGFITVDEAIELIEAHTDEEPTVDLTQLIQTVDYIKKGWNFRIPLARKENGKTISDTDTTCYVENELQLQLLRNAIKESFHKATGRSLNLDLDSNYAPVRNMSTVIGDGASGRPVQNIETNPKVGAPIAKGDMLKPGLIGY